ncbi:MAG: hypothetical protein FJ096_08900 [Deltaproteobacteria bacterium]|nr:hypothetical protein [Deltaproteobacteria bacterium]
MIAPTRLGVLLVAACTVAEVGGCVSERHPLANNGGAVEFLLDDAPLFAADMLDTSGAPVLPRQVPFEKPVKLYLTQDGSPDRGAYVDLRVEPPNALELFSVDQSCEKLQGTFRCTAGGDGFANLAIRSTSTVSGDAKLMVIGRESAQASVTILPAGLPDGATSFQLAIEGASSSRVQARYDKLACELTAAPDTPFDKWPTGAIRVRTARVLASAPPSSPGLLEHAPVLIETLAPEASVSLDPTCPSPHERRLRVQLDALGRSPEVFLCFSDLGGEAIEFVAQSGANKRDERQVRVDPEPRLLRVETTVDPLEPTSSLGQLAIQLSAYDADLNRIALEVELQSTDSAVLKPDKSNVKLLDGEDVDVFVTTGLPGTASLVAKPLLFEMPACESALITVAEP